MRTQKTRSKEDKFAAEFFLNRLQLFEHHMGKEEDRKEKRERREKESDHKKSTKSSRKKLMKR